MFKFFCVSSLLLLSGLVIASPGCASDGKDGVSCSVVDNGDGTATISCSDGSETTISGGQDGTDGTNGTTGDSCTIADNGDGTSTITCEDGTSVDFPNALCGNGVTEGGEACDGDLGCSETCTVNSFQGTLVAGVKTFHGASTEYTSVRRFSSGRIGFVYRQEQAPRQTFFKLYDENALAVLSDAVQVEQTNIVKLATMTNNTIAMVYAAPTDNNRGKFVFMNDSGHPTGPAVTFSNGSELMETVGLSNGSLFIAHNGGGASFAIYDPTGTLVTSGQFTTGIVFDFAVTQFSGGRVLVSWSEEDGSDKRTYYAVVGQDGTIATARTLLDNEGAFEYGLSAAPFGNDSVLVAFSKPGVSGSFAIIQSDGTVSTASTSFQASFTRSIVAVPAGVDGAKVGIMSRDIGNGDTGRFVTIDSAGNVDSSIDFIGGVIDQASATLLQNGSVLLAFANLGNGNPPFLGQFVIIE